MRTALLADMERSAQERFEEILKSYKSDLTTNLRGVFDPRDFEKILDLAGAKLKTELIGKSSPIRVSEVNEAWQKVVTDFFRSKFWGFPLKSGHYEDIHFNLPMEQLEVHEQEHLFNRDNLKKAMPYLRQFFIGLIVWKIAVIYLFQQGCFDWGILTNK